MTTSKKLQSTLAGIVAGGEAAEGVSFDGTNDYLSRSSDLTGNTNSKTFTFSFWIYAPKTTTEQGRIYSNGTSNTQSRIQVYLNDASDNNFYITIGSSNLLTMTFPTGAVTWNRWNHVLLSCDMSNSSNRHLYINDNLISDSAFTNYVNAVLPFSNSRHNIGTRDYGTTPDYSLKGRLAHVYLDYTYRDLSNSANRRLFITDDYKPADNQASLSPILYLPLTDADTAGTNAGTGGDFTVNGVLDTAQRGPNQNNCVASEFDGSNDELLNTSLSASNSKVFTFSTVINVGSSNSNDFIFTNMNSSNDTIFTVYTNGNDISISGSTGGPNVLVASTSSNLLAVGRNYTLTMSMDLSNTSNRYVYLDGVDITSSFSFSDYSNTAIAFSNIAEWNIGSRRSGGVFYSGSIGELYFDTTYTDLSADNPFWDEDANRPKPVRQVLDETGNTPLIAMPIEASNPGLNLGTGGDFTVNGGGLTGARGGSEYWARSARFNGSTGYLAKDVGTSTTKTFSLMLCVNKDVNSPMFFNFGTTHKLYIALDHNTTAQCRIIGKNSGGTTILDYEPNNGSGSFPNVMLLSVDMASTTVNMYIDGVHVTDSSFTCTNDFLDIDGPCEIGRYSTSYSSNDAASVYFTTNYIDFSQESNRNLFVDQLGYPKDLTPAIEAGDIPTPSVYMKFDDPDNLGANSGTGGDFTINGTVTQGSDVDPNA